MRKKLISGISVEHDRILRALDDGEPHVFIGLDAYRVGDLLAKGKVEHICVVVRKEKA